MEAFIVIYFICSDADCGKCVSRVCASIIKLSMFKFNQCTNSVQCRPNLMKN